MISSEKQLILKMIFFNEKNPQQNQCAVQTFR